MSQGKITEKQKEILEFIKETILSKGYPPAVREICEAVHLKSTSSVHSHLETLERNGYIRRDPTKPRTIEILDDDFALTRREVVNVPLIGTVAAGMPILAEENIEDYIPIPAELLPNKEVFMLRVKGNSMVEAGILNDDKVIVAKQPVAENGDKVVALLGDSATVKTFYKESGHVRPAAGKFFYGPDHRGRRPDPWKGHRPVPVYELAGMMPACGGLLRTQTFLPPYGEPCRAFYMPQDTHFSNQKAPASPLENSRCFRYMFFVRLRSGSVQFLYGSYDLSVSPDALQIIEQPVFLGKYMNDHIAVVQKDPC